MNHSIVGDRKSAYGVPSVSKVPMECRQCQKCLWSAVSIKSAFTFIEKCGFIIVRGLLLDIVRVL